MSGIGKLMLLAAALLWISAASARVLQEEPAYYIFGYGSLLLKESRAKTNCAIRNLSEQQLSGLGSLPGGPFKTVEEYIEQCDNKGERPVRVKGIKRAWNAPGTLYPGVNGAAWSNSAFGRVPTFLGATTTSAASVTCTGVVYPVTAKEFAAQVEREKKAGYLVTTLKPSDVTFLDGKAAPPQNAPIIFFASAKESLKIATAEAPIVMSYVDIWLGGALQLERQFNLTGPEYKKESGGKYDSFAAETVATTYDWSAHWWNDRLLPLRPWIYNPDAASIDKMLLKYVKPSILQSISFPGQLPGTSRG